MKLILKYLKPFAVGVLLCIAMLFVQAYTDLSLPNIMSTIVDGGVVAGGIESGAPEVITPDGAALMGTMMTEEEYESFISAYSLKQSGSVDSNTLKTFPGAANREVYVLKQSSDEADHAYNTGAYSLYLLISDMAQQAGDSSLYNSEDGISEIDMSVLYSMTELLNAYPKEVKDDYMAEAEAAQELTVSSIAKTFTGLFYNELDADMDAIQSSFIWKNGFKMIGYTILNALAAVFVGFLCATIASKLARNLRRDVFAKVNGFSNAEFDKFSTASLITRTTNDIQQVQNLTTMGMRMMFYAPIMGIGGVVLALQKSPSLSWTIGLAVVVMLSLLVMIFILAMPKFKLQQKLIDKVNLVSRENLSGLMVIRAFGNEKREEDRFAGANAELANTQRFIQRLMSFTMPAMMLVMNLVTLLIVWVGAKEISNFSLQIGDMMAFIQYGMQIIMSFLMIAMMFIMLPRAAVSATRISEVLDTKEAITDKENTVKTGRLKGKVEFKNVCFRYNNAEEDVLSNISFEALPGQTTAFIGATGSGKSTVVNLIPRFYDVTQGEILIDGVDIRDMSQEELRSNIGYVPQKGMLFSGTIDSNIRYGKEDAEEKEIEEALKVAQAEDFVNTKTGGTASPIAQGATNVSGGQKQRLSIARALVRKAPIYIFDDIFSALDFKTDSALRKALGEYSADSTVIIVAQRVSTILHADCINVIDNGVIVGSGTHEELLKNCMEYREIAESQLSQEELYNE